MLLTITYAGQNTEDLGYLLYKNPYRPQAFELSHGKAYVFYPEFSNERTTAALLLEIDPIDLARGKAGSSGGGLFDYVNDRPYVSSSFLSTAISKVFGTAMTGRADGRQELSDSALDLTAKIYMLPCRGEQEKIKNVFEPLGYFVEYESFITDENFPEWGESKYVNLTICGKVRLRDLLKHLYVLIPVFDRQKHYWVGSDEVEKLLRLGEGWLSGHPEKTYIAGRYLNRRRSLVNMAFMRLAAAEEADEADETEETGATNETDETEDLENLPEKTQSLNTRRLSSVVAALKDCGAKRVIDIGCGEGNLLRLLLADPHFTDIAGADVSHTALRRANEKLKPVQAREKIQLFQASLIYKDARFSGYDAACVIEVIEHLDAGRLAAFERVLFEFAKPPVVVLTTPNKEYNINYKFINEKSLRHGDHRFEWTRKEFKAWAMSAADKFGYAAQLSEIGDTDENFGAPTQMGVFKLL
jgi:3' terminal RNA ribose 2'-O-methyltransferase Hen1